MFINPAEVVLFLTGADTPKRSRKYPGTEWARET